MLAAREAHSTRGSDGRGARLALLEPRQALCERSNSNESDGLELSDCGPDGSDFDLGGRRGRVVGLRGGALERAVRGRCDPFGVGSCNDTQETDGRVETRGSTACFSNVEVRVIELDTAPVVTRVLVRSIIEL